MSQEDGFLARWSRRKALVRQGEAPPPEPAVPAAAAPSLPAPPAVAPAAATAPAAAAVAHDEAAEAAPAPPTLAEAEALTPEADFTRFVARDVDPAVKNTALKKLFADPHFNVMDGLDTYIDDYGIPDPLPPGMLEKMTQSAFLGLFKATEPVPPDAPAAADAPALPPEAIAAGDNDAAPPSLPPEPLSDEDPDLRLQPHDAAGHGGDQPRAGEDTGREH